MPRDRLLLDSAYMYVCVWQPAARYHKAYTDLSAARVPGGGGGGVYYAQSAALSTGKRFTPKMAPITPLDMRGGASFSRLLEILEGFGVAPVVLSFLVRRW